MAKKDEQPSYDAAIEELETILNKRCSLAPTFCKVLVQVMVDLQMHRQQSRPFAGKDGFITARDLFRWARRSASTRSRRRSSGRRRCWCGAEACSGRRSCASRRR